MARRHRILETEMKYVMKAVHYRLGYLAEEGNVGEEAQELFRTLWRFHRHRSGPPGYPEEITEEEITGLLYSTMDLRDFHVQAQP